MLAINDALGMIVLELGMLGRFIGRNGKLKGMSDELRARCAAAWPDILNRIAEGESIASACKAHNLGRETIREYRAGSKALLDQWEDARKASADSFFEEAMAAARDPHIDLVDSNGKTVQVRRYADSTRVLVDTLKWAAAKRNPREYNDKSQIDVNVKTVDLTAIIRDANARLAASKSGQIIDGQFQRIDNNRDTSVANIHAQSLIPPELAALL